jgi:tetratricopeptide (TPR) repeat protein
MSQRALVLGSILLTVLISGVRAEDPPALEALPRASGQPDAKPNSGGPNPTPFSVNMWVAVRPNVTLNDDRNNRLAASTLPMLYHIDTIDPTDPDRYRLSGDVSGWAKKSDLKSLEETLVELTNLIRQWPCEPKLHYASGVVVMELQPQRFLPAIADFDEALRLNPGYAWAYYYRAIANGNLSRWERALGDLYEAIRLEPGNPYMYVARAKVAKEMKLRSRAIEDYTTALRLAPNNSEAKSGLDMLASESTTSTPPPGDKPVPQDPSKSTAAPVPSPVLQLAVDQAAIEEANARAAAARAKIEDLRAQIEEARARAEKAMLDAERYRRQRLQKP